ncbi:MAG TPA: aminotransferase class III-fold pyridoxal phosphate-dependent enzyme, partial [bacterium]|nr:aminotransferase class III-fold pyridoxal phosphate-dependent enzyme [bacterium]
MDKIFNQKDRDAIKTIRIAKRFLQQKKEKQLLEIIGKEINAIPDASYIEKKWFQKSYIIGNQKDDFLTGKGVFYITEGRKLFLDATAGHYQMTFGYNHPFLMKKLNEALEMGVPWDCHSNIPGFFVKKLSEKIIQICNPESTLYQVQKNENSLNTVLLGIATGSVACSSAMKIALNYFKKNKGKQKKVVLISLNGNYHGTDFLMQRLRGMWQWIFSENLVFETIEPNDIKMMRDVFKKHGENIAGFFFEPVMMNREAILLNKDFVCEARKLTELVDALLIVDEIQTGLWYPEIFMYKQFGITPDIVILGKGLNA